MPEIEGLDSTRGLHPIIDGALQAFRLSGQGELRVDVPPLNTESRKSAVSARDRAIGPSWYSGVRDTVWVLGSSSRATGWVTVMVVRQEGATPIVVGSHRDRRPTVAGDCVDAGARSPLEIGVRLRWDRVQVHQASEVEGPQERAIARVVWARGPSAC